MLGQGQHGGPLMGQGHGRRPPGAAQLPHHRRAAHPVVTVPIVGTNTAQLVVGQLGRRLVMDGDLLATGVPGQRHQAEQGRGCGRAVQVAIATYGPGEGAPGATVGRVQVGHDLGPGRSQRQRPVLGHPVGVARAGQHVAQRHPRAGQVGQGGDEGGHGVEVAGTEGGPAHQLGHRRAGLVIDHGGGREVVPKEKLVFLPGPVAPAVAPGRFGIDAGAHVGYRWAGEALHVGPVHGQGGGERFGPLGHTGLQQGSRKAGQGGRRLAIGAGFLERAGQGPGGVLHLAVGEAMRAAPPVHHHPEPGRGLG